METDQEVNTEPAVAADVCSKCSGPLDTEGNPQWCKRCRAEYQRAYQDSKVGRAEMKGFARGVSATKRILAEEFARMSPSSLPAIEAAKWIAGAPGPKFED